MIVLVTVSKVVSYFDYLVVIVVVQQVLVNMNENEIYVSKMDNEISEVIKVSYHQVLVEVLKLVEAV